VKLSRSDVVRLDREHLWHPYTPADTWEATDPIVVVRAEGSYLFDANGSRFLDGNSSWWVAALGHGHPRLLSAMQAQAKTLAHCALAGITHEPAVLLAQDLLRTAPQGLSRVFYTDDGSTAIDLAVKMSVQSFKNRGMPHKTRFVALDGAFHGDTVGATSLGGVDVFRTPYAGVLFDCVRADFPAGEGGYARAFETISDIVKQGKDSIAAVVVESIVQGSAGMRFYDPAYLRELRTLTKDAGVLLIVDEVFSGYGRTGTMWACEHAGITPDIMCIGKAMSALVPMGAALTTEAVFNTFRGTKDRALWYGHTFCGNPIGAALAREVLAIYDDERIVEQVLRKEKIIAKAFARIAEIRGVQSTRHIGMIGAADLASLTGGNGYLGGLGWRVYDEARRRGAYLRPLGDTIYVCPPLNIEDTDLDTLLGIVEESLRATLR